MFSSQLLGPLSKTVAPECSSCSPSQHQADAALHPVPLREHHVCQQK